MSIYRPTFLYIKQHKITGLLYFGKTIKKDPVKYKGSGKYWTVHFEKHGREHVETLWYCLFFDEETLVNFATNFSKQENIVESTGWANLKIETGLDDRPASYKDEIRPRKQRKKETRPRNKGCLSEIHKRRIGLAVKGRIHTYKNEETKLKVINATKLARSLEKWTCPHCGKSGSGEGNRVRYHFDKCKLLLGTENNQNGIWSPLNNISKS